MPSMPAEECRKILIHYYIFVNNSNQETIVRWINRNPIYSIGNKLCQESAVARIVSIIIKTLNYTSIRTEARV